MRGIRKIILVVLLISISIGLLVIEKSINTKKQMENDVNIIVVDKKD